MGHNKVILELHTELSVMVYFMISYKMIFKHPLT